MARKPINHLPRHRPCLAHFVASTRPQAAPAALHGAQTEAAARPSSCRVT